MSQFAHAVLDLMFSNAVEDATGKIGNYDGFPKLVFAVASAVMALLIILLDFLIFSLKRRSLLSLSYGTPASTVRLALLWSLGAGIGGLLGTQAQIVKISTAACISMGVGWPAILPRLIESAKDDDDEVERSAEE